MKANEVVQMSDEQLAAAVDEGLSQLTPRARTHALAVAGGKTAAAAAREAGTSTNGRVLARMKARTAPVLALLREQQRRRSQVSAEETARWFEALADDAWAAKEYAAARAARREAALIRSAYPDARIRVEHELLDTREVTPEEIEALALLRHGVRRQLPGDVIEAEVTPILSAMSPAALQPREPTARALSREGTEGSDAL